MKQNEYKTTDLNIASILTTLEYTIKRLDRENSRRIIFVFQDEFEIQNVIGNYWADALSVNPRKLFDNQKMLKTRIYNE